MRKFTIIFFFILLLSVVPFFVSAQTEVIYPSLPGVLTPQDIANEAQTEAEVLPLFMAYLFRLILVVSLLVVIGVILYAGILYLLSTGNPIKSKIAREWILSAIQGALVIFTSYALLFALDSQLVLFGQRNLEKGENVERVDLDWEIRNSYFQIPFGLLIEDAILNENAKNKLYDVLDATNEAEAVAEAIYQGSKQLLAIIESCPAGMPCGGGGPFSGPGPIPYDEPSPEERDSGNSNVPPAKNGKNAENGTSAMPVVIPGRTGGMYYEDENGNWQPIKDANHWKSLPGAKIKVIWDDEKGSFIYNKTFSSTIFPFGDYKKKNSTRNIDLHDFNPPFIFTSKVSLPSKIIHSVATLYSAPLVFAENESHVIIQKFSRNIGFWFSDYIKKIEIDMLSADRSSPTPLLYEMKFQQETNRPGHTRYIFNRVDNNTLSVKEKKVDFFLTRNNLIQEIQKFGVILYSKIVTIFYTDLIFAEERAIKDVTSEQELITDFGYERYDVKKTNNPIYDETAAIYNFYRNPDTNNVAVVPKSGETTEPSALIKPDKDNISEMLLTQAFFEEIGLPLVGVIYDVFEDLDVEETPKEEEKEELPQEEETPPADLCCPPCPNIASLVQAKIAEIESYFPIFLEKLEALLQTKEPIKEDLFQLYKAVMIKSLGAEHLMGYNSLLLARRYYEKEEIVIRTDDEKTEIGRYYWDWSQWLYNTLYRIKTEDKIIEENDPVTFYLRNPVAKKIVEDATSLALAAKEEGIQDAGNLIGVPRKMPPPPPDFGTKFYPPTNPEKTRITSLFGWRYDPFTMERVMHYGIDFAGPRYSPIYASEKGEVIFSGWMGTQTTGYGVLIAIYHKASKIDESAQDIVTYYAHLEPNSLMVKRGDIVSRGQHIAGMGTTGRSTGYHLHYETRSEVSYPYILHTGTQINPESFIDIDYYSSNENYFLSYKENLLEKIFKNLCIKDVSAQTDLEILYNYLTENNIKVEDLTEEQLLKILTTLGISAEFVPLLVGDALKLPSDFLSCGMEIPVGETFELTWDHLVELLDTIDYYVSEGARLIEQQKLMNELSRPCSCPCQGDCCECEEPICGGCALTCNLGAIRAAHAAVAKTREKLREIAAHIELLTNGHFNTPTEELCDDLNEDIRDDKERILCAGGGSKLITKHELITRKLNYSRTRFDECITRPEQIDDVLSGSRKGRTPFFGPIAEENQFKRYTKTTKDGFLVNTSDFNWFCCSDSEE